MFFADALTLDAPRRTADGYMAVRARAARTGVYAYQGREIDPNNEHGLRDAGMVNVLRDEQIVFDETSARSFIGKPVTDDHPHDAVTADNWKQHARGMVMGAMRDGDYLAFDLLLTDAAAIAKVDAGKRELSNGYSASLEFGDYTGPAGEKCVARQSALKGNHVAIVDKGRAGAACRIGDAATCDTIPKADFDALVERTYTATDESDNNPPERSDASDPNSRGRPLTDGDAPMATKTILVDGLQVEVTDAAEAAINKLQGQLRDAASAKATVDTELATAQTTITTKDAEIVTLTKAVEDAKVTPAQLRDAAKVYATVCDKAKALVPALSITDAMDADAIMKAVVDAKMGDAAKDWTVDQVAASFAVLAKDTKTPDPLRDVLTDGIRTSQGGAASIQTARAKWLADKEGAYRARQEA